MTSVHGTGIEWTHVPGYKGETWNPVRGCTKVSPGCKHCYAETFAERWRGVVMPNGEPHAYHQGFDLRLVPEKLDEPLRKRDPRAYFVNSMSDLHQDGVPYDFLLRTYEIMASCPRHLFMVLTKRAESMRSAVLSMEDASHVTPWVEHPTGPPNVWLGVSVEDRKYGLPRVDILRAIPAAVRFLSIEPLLEDLGDIDLTGIHWVIVGGESGNKARDFDIAWARRIVAQCREQGVAAFVKQLGAAPVGRVPMGGLEAIVPLRLKSKKGADESEWPDDLRGIKEWPRCVTDKAVHPCA